MKGTILLVMLALLGWNLLGNDGVPVAISPGSDAGVAAVGNGCPTFSWSGVAWAQKYRVVVFGVEGEKTRSGGEPALTAQPVLSEDIAGGGLSWTPSLSQGLAAGADYAWCVGALDSDGAWAWSATRRFRVEQGTRSALSEEDTAGLNEEKERATSAAASDSSRETATDKKESGDGIAKPMGSEGAISTFYGTNAGASNSSDANGNSFFGSGAGLSNTTGAYNTFMGRAAGSANTTGYHNTILGYWAGQANNGNDNTFVGYQTGPNNSSGYSNLFLGMTAGGLNTTGYQNVFLGTEAGYSNSTANKNILIGHQAGKNMTSGPNVFIGYQAGLYTNSGSYNTFLGFQTGYTNSSGTKNTFLGNSAGGSNSTGGYNTYVGAYAGDLNSTGSRNVCLGYAAGTNEQGSDKLYIDISDTSAPLIWGNFSTNMVGINGWLGVGTQAPVYPIELKTTGRNAAIVATRTDGATNFVNATTTYGQFGTVNNFAVRILANSTWRMTLNTDNSLAMASGATCTAGGVWTNASSLALKENITALNGDEAANTLQSLNPVKYNYKADKEEKYVGFIAEEVPELVSMNDRKSLSAMDIVAVLTKVVQEQQKLNQEQQKILSAQEQAISELKEEIATMKKRSQK